MRGENLRVKESLAFVKGVDGAASRGVVVLRFGRLSPEHAAGNTVNEKIQKSCFVNRMLEISDV